MMIFTSDQIQTADLVVDAEYQGLRRGNAGDDPLHKLLGVSNQGGFRYLGTVERPTLIVLTSSLSDLDWPDGIDIQSGLFTYYGDNKEPGRELHDTPRFGNRLLRDMFNSLHTGERQLVPPVLVFTSAGHYRDVIFRGLAVPGGEGLSQNEDLVAVWRISREQRFQNYQAKFTILDVPRVSRKWIEMLRAGEDHRAHAPRIWTSWLVRGAYQSLHAIRTVEIRTKHEQLPIDAGEARLVDEIVRYFADYPTRFESCAAALTRIALGENVSSIDLTRPTRDGGRDAVGRYRLGAIESGIEVDFAVEAKCYSANNSVGVRELSRLISRLRHRQFGVLVTTSWVNAQAYREIKEDGHPIIIVTGSDIVRLLKSHGLADLDRLKAWLQTSFPKL